MSHAASSECETSLDRWRAGPAGWWHAGRRAVTGAACVGSGGRRGVPGERRWRVGSHGGGVRERRRWVVSGGIGGLQADRAFPPSLSVQPSKLPLYSNVGGWGFSSGCRNLHPLRQIVLLSWTCNLSTDLDVLGIQFFHQIFSIFAMRVACWSSDCEGEKQRRVRVSPVPPHTFRAPPCSFNFLLSQ